jgi:hypothetical protein
VTQKARDWDDVERIAGIKRTVPASVTRRDVEVMTGKLLKGPFWRRKRR